MDNLTCTTQHVFSKELKTLTSLWDIVKGELIRVFATLTPGYGIYLCVWL